MVCLALITGYAGAQAAPQLRVTFSGGWSARDRWFQLSGEFSYRI